MRLSLKVYATAIGSAAAVLLAAIGIRRGWDLAAAPGQPKECLFTYPPLAEKRTETVLPERYPLHVPFSQRAGFVHDASCLNRTPVYGVIAVRTEEDVRNALQFARDNAVRVSIAGQRHSMGGQSFVRNGVVLDMRPYNAMQIDTKNKRMTVQAGATWAEIQQALDAQGLSVRAMQSINIFTVGGTLSVNAHGIAHDPGPVGSSVESMRIMLPDGSIQTASRTDNPDLFRHALGGYGLFGVILDATIGLTNNEAYVQEERTVQYADFPDLYQKDIEGNDAYGLFYGRLSMAPSTFLREMIVRGFRRIEPESPVSIPPLQPQSRIALRRFVINFSKTGPAGRALRWWLEKHIDPRLRTCVSRNNALNAGNDECIVSRNQAMYDSMQYLQNRLPDTDILQEYFVPPDQFTSFVDGLRGIVAENNANLLNVTVRIVHKDSDTALPYAKQNMFALVLYFNQKQNAADSAVLERTTGELIDLAVAHDGTFYLPYQLYYSDEQLRESYPEIDAFFAMKKKMDPDGLLTNTWYEKYGSVR